MSLTIAITPDIESRLREVAASQGVDPDEYVANALREHLQAVGSAVPHLSAEESRLLGEINQGLSEQQWERYRELIEKRRAEQLSHEEHAELITISDLVERLNLRRIECLTQLAALRDTTLPKLMEQLGIEPAPVI